MTPTEPANDKAADPYAFVADHAAQCAYWADFAREGAAIRDDALLIYAAKKTAAHARAFVSVVKECIAPERRASV